MSGPDSKLEFETRCVTGGSNPEQWANREIVPPISTTTIYKQEAPGVFKEFDYSRHGNPTRSALERALAELDGANYGLAFSSGMAAITTVGHLLSNGDHLVAMDDLYGGTSRFFSKIASRMGITTTYVDGTDTENLEKVWQKNTKMVWLESPSNPNLKVFNIAEIAEWAHKMNPDSIVVVDNTFLSPCFMKPLALGADITVMSLSKYVGGHNDILMGSTTLNCKDLYEKLYFLQLAMGAVPSPIDCSQVLRSIKSLSLRMDKHQANGLQVAKFLEGHERVSKVIHPLLPSHPQYELTKNQASGHSGMISFYLHGSFENTIQFFSHLKLIPSAPSLGGCNTTIALPVTMIPTTQAYVNLSNHSDESKKLIRISVGLENANDLIKDLDQALKKTFD